MVIIKGNETPIVAKMMWKAERHAHLGTCRKQVIHIAAPIIALAGRTCNSFATLPSAVDAREYNGLPTLPVVFYPRFLRLIGRELMIRAFFKDHVRSLPRLVIDQTPFMTRTCVVFCHEDIARMNRESLATNGRKFEYAAQGNYILRSWIVMPVIGGMCCRFLEVDCFHIHECTFIYGPSYHMGISLRTCVQPVCSNHFPSPFVVMLLMFKIAAVSARNCWQRAAFSISD